MIRAAHLTELRRLRPSTPWVRELALGLAGLLAAGLLAIGASGAVAAAMGAVWGHAFVAGDVSGVTYTPARCAEYHALQPGASTCEGAAVDHHYEEIVDYRLAAGVVGLAVLGGTAVVRRRRRRRDGIHAVIPPALLPAVGAALFGVAAAALTLDTVGRLVDGPAHGAGGTLSAVIVATPIAVVCAVRCALALDQPEPGAGG